MRKILLTLFVALSGCCLGAGFDPDPAKIQFTWPVSGIVFQGFYGDQISGEGPGLYYDENDLQKMWSGPGRMHRAIDIDNLSGAAVEAALDGIAHRYDWDKKHPYGNRVVIDHGNGYFTLYAHLSEIEVKEGKRVEKGDQIGRVGSTGNSTGPHLHFEIRHSPNGDFTEAPHFVPGKKRDIIIRGDIVPHNYPR